MERSDVVGDGTNQGTRNPAWTRDELILALDLYFQLSPQIGAANHPAIIELSEILDLLPIHLDRTNISNFRNPTGVYMKLNNFRAIDPAHNGVGLSHGSKRDVDIWNEFADDQQTLHQVAEGIRAFARAPVAIELRTGEEGEGDTAAREGTLLLRQHKIRERNRDLVRKKKEKAKNAEGLLRCEACGFVFHEFYGELGLDYIECHHLTPLAELRPGQPTRLSDLALLCANCHRMIHRNGRVRSIGELQNTIRAAKILGDEASFGEPR